MMLWAMSWMLSCVECKARGRGYRGLINLEYLKCARGWKNGLLIPYEKATRAKEDCNTGFHLSLRLRPCLPAPMRQKVVLIEECAYHVRCAGVGQLFVHRYVRLGAKR